MFVEKEGRYKVLSMVLSIVFILIGIFFLLGGIGLKNKIKNDQKHGQRKFNFREIAGVCAIGVIFLMAGLWIWLFK